MRSALVSSMFIMVGGIVFLLAINGNALLVAVDPNKQHEAIRGIDEEDSTPNLLDGEADDDSSSRSVRQSPPLVDLHEKVIVSSKKDCFYDHDDLREERQHPNRPSTSSGHHCLDDDANQGTHSDSNPDRGDDCDYKHSQQETDDYDVMKCPDELPHDSSTRHETCSIDKRDKKPDDRKAGISEVEADRSEVGGTDSPSSLSSTSRGSQGLSFADLVTLAVLMASMVIISYLLVMVSLRVMEAIDDYWVNSSEDL